MRGRRTGEEAQHSKQHAQRLVDLQHLWLGYRPSKRFAIQCVQHVLAQLKDEQRRASLLKPSEIQRTLYSSASWWQGAAVAAAAAAAAGRSNQCSVTRSALHADLGFRL